MMKGYFYTEAGIPVPQEPVELEGCLESSIDSALKMFESNNVELKNKSAAWALLSLSCKVLVKSKKKEEVTFNGRLLICD